MTRSNPIPLHRFTKFPSKSLCNPPTPQRTAPQTIMQQLPMPTLAQKHTLIRGNKMNAKKEQFKKSKIRREIQEVLPRFELGLPEFLTAISKSGVITTTLQNPLPETLPGKQFAISIYIRNSHRVGWNGKSLFRLGTLICLLIHSFIHSCVCFASDFVTQNTCSHQMTKHSIYSSSQIPPTLGFPNLPVPRPGAYIPELRNLKIRQSHPLHTHDAPP